MRALISSAAALSCLTGALDARAQIKEPGRHPSFILSDDFAITLRIGWPYVSVGASFLL